jgi:hypothetical protein
VVAVSNLSFKSTKREQDPNVGQLVTFELDDEDYAACRPKDEGFLLIVQAAATAASLPDKINGVMQFLDLCFNPDQITEALDKLDSAQLDALLGSGREAYPVELAQSGYRLHRRLVDFRDDLTMGDLVDVMTGLVEAWTGKAPGRPQDYLPSSKRSGTKSTARSRSRASTGTASGAVARRKR